MSVKARSVESGNVALIERFYHEMWNRIRDVWVLGDVYGLTDLTQPLRKQRG